MSVYNEDELSAPQWMDATFYETVLRAYENDEDVQIIKVQTSPATMKGDHYASIMFRVSVEYRFAKHGSTMTRSLIVKTVPEASGPKRDMIMHSQLFETEIAMYTQTLPKIEQILAQHGDMVSLAPKMIYHALQPNKVIILEDLCEVGYDTVRGRYLNEHEVTAVLSKLAKMHAVSYMLGKSAQHEIVTKYKEGIFNTSAVVSNPMISDGIKKFIQMLSAHDDLRAYVPKFREIELKLFGACKQLYRAYAADIKDEIYVLNHGDFHLKNLMFQYAKKTEMVDFVMVDFQISVFGPSVIDLVYATYMLLSPEQRAQRDVCLHKYFEQFIATLKLINYQGELPQFAHLQMAQLRYRHFALFILSTFLPIVYSLYTLSPNDMKDQSSADMLKNSDQLNKFYYNPAFVAEVRKLLPAFLNAGYLD